MVDKFKKYKTAEGKVFYDWDNVIPKMQAAYKARKHVMLIGPKGVGKNHAVEQLATEEKQKLDSINFSLRTRESHIVGSTTMKEGTAEWQDAVLTKSMRSGSIFNADEINSAEADVLIRLDEALDDRRQLVLKEASSGEVVKAAETWWAVATINPLSHLGTKPLPDQIIRRFPVRIYMKYPDEDTEVEIVTARTGSKNPELRTAVQLAQKLRGSTDIGDLPYAPSISETIAFIELLDTNKTLKPKEAAEMIFRDVYYQFVDYYDKIGNVQQLINSMWTK